MKFVRRSKGSPCARKAISVIRRTAAEQSSLRMLTPTPPVWMSPAPPHVPARRFRPCGGTAYQRPHYHLPRHQASLCERHQPSSPAPASVPLRKYSALTPPAVAFLRERPPGQRLPRLVRLSSHGSAAHRRPSRASLAPPQRPHANVPAASVSHACVSPLRTHSLSVPPTQVQRTPSVLASPAPAGVTA